ncbi:amidohydrolase [Aureivirga marina]|uniref:amidohydrolase n=1 Tax=Aureivirga marina TaxID=1182451 RepID=UPI0018CB45E8|nr:amidohydrolase family protein [Aureivirga marina]
MNKQKTNDCIHCGCHNPITKEMEENLKPLPKIIYPKKKHKKPTLLYICKEDSASIIPINNNQTAKVKAIAFHEGKVLANGTEDYVKSILDKKKVSYDTIYLTKNQTLLPGFVEPHMHIIPSSFLGTWKNLSRIENQKLIPKYDFDYIKETIQNEIKILKNVDSDAKVLWFFGKEVDPSLMPFKINQSPGSLTQLETFDFERLDQISTETPIVLMAASMHTLYLNKLALEKTYKANSLNEDFKKLYESLEDFINKTNGMLQEVEQMKWLVPALPINQVSFMVENVSKYVAETFDEAAKQGVTFLYDAALQKSSIEFLKLYADLNEIPVRFGGAKIYFSENQAEDLKEFEKIENYHNGYIASIKIVSDGSNQGLTGSQTEYYCCEPKNNLGIANFSNQELRELTRICIDKGWSIMTHANGDAAVSQTIDAFEYAFKFSVEKKNPLDFRNRVEHCSILNETNLFRLKKLNLSPSFLIGHVGYWGYVFRNAIFMEKAEKLDLCQSALDHGLKISFHSDFGVSPIGGLRMMEQAITRVMEASPNSPQIHEKNVLNPKERISPVNALRAVTIDAAWQCHADNWVGSLEEGKFADYVILEQNPLEMPNPFLNMRNIKVEETWKDGIQVYPKL